MRKIRVVQQYVNAANNGGLKTEYEALNNRKIYWTNMSLSRWC